MVPKFKRSKPSCNPKIPSFTWFLNKVRWSIIRLLETNRSYNFVPCSSCSVITPGFFSLASLLRTDETKLSLYAERFAFKNTPPPAQTEAKFSGSSRRRILKKHLPWLIANCTPEASWLKLSVIDSCKWRRTTIYV